MKVKVALQNLCTRDWSWFEFPTNLVKVKERLKYQSGDEIIVTDCEGIKIPEYTSLKDIQQFAEQLEEVPSSYRECLDDWLSIYGSIQEFTSEFNLDVWHIIEVSNDREFGETMVYEYEGITIPTELENYFDFEAYGRDCRLNSSNFFATDNYYVFQ